MVMGMDFGEGSKSPYMKRRDRTIGRGSGRPIEGGRFGGGEQPTSTSGSPLDPGGVTGSPVGGVTSLPVGETTPTGSGIEATQKQTPYAGFLKGLTQPIGSPYESQFKERANLLREYTQGAYGTAAEGMRTAMGGKGFRAGESGIADTAIGRIQKAGAEELSRGYRGLAVEEGRREQELGFGTAQLNLQRQMGGAGIALRGEEGALDRMMQYYQSQLGAETAEFQPWWQGTARSF